MNRNVLFFLFVLGLFAFFAQVALAGLLPDQALLVYGDATGIPKYRTWNTTLSAEKSASNTGADVEWAELARHPFKREVSMITLQNPAGASDTAHFQLWNGTAWTSLTQAGVDSDVAYHGVDVVYETKSGRAMMVYTDNDQATPLYRLWDGSMSAEAALPAVNGGVIRLLTMGSSPLKNEILLLTEDSTNDVNFYSWNGNAWSGPTEVSTTAWGDFQALGIGYERVSGNALVMYANSSVNSPVYRRWTSANTSLSQQFSALSLGSVPVFIEVASHPVTNEITSINWLSSGATATMVWNGTAWGSNLTVAPSSIGTVAVAYEQLSGRSMVVYDNLSSTVFYRLWNGTSWGAQGTIGNVGDTPFWAELGAKTSSNELTLLVGDSGSDVSAFIWNGTTWSSQGEIQTNGFGFARRGMDTEYVMINDTLPPVFSNAIATPPSPVYYNNTLTSMFNITVVDDAALGSVSLVFDGVSQTLTALGSVYSFTPYGLAVGQHNLTWTANDTSGNVNSTSGTYVVYQSPTEVTLLLNGTSNNLTILQNSDVVIDGSLTNTTGLVVLSIDWNLEASSQTSLTYTKNFTSNGTFPVTLSFAGNTNYTGSTQTHFVTVLFDNSSSPSPPPPLTPTEVTLTLNGTSANITLMQDTIIALSGSLLNATGIINLTVDGIVEGSDINTLMIMKNFTSNGTFPVSLYYYGDSTHLASNVTYYAVVTPLNITEETSNTANTTSPPGDGESSGSSLSSGSSPDTGNPAAASKFRAGQAPATSQHVAAPSTSTPSQPSSGSSPSSGSASSGLSGITGAAVQQPSSESTWTFAGALHSVVSFFGQYIGILLIIVLAGFVLVIVAKQVRQQRRISLPFSRLRSLLPSSQPKKIPVLQRKKIIVPAPQQETPVTAYLRTLQSTYQQDRVKKDLQAVNSSLLHRRDSVPRKINIKHLPAAEKMNKKSGDVIKELKEVFKLE